MRALVAEQDPLIVIGAIRALQLATITVDTAKSGEDAADMARHYDYDVVIIGLQLTDMDGLEAVRLIRARGINLPVVATTGTDDLPARVQALDLGADDCITRATDKVELVARIRAVIRRSKGYARSTLISGNLSLDIQSKEVHVNGNYVNLTGKESLILELLMLRKGAIQSKGAILTHLYNGIDEPEMKIIDVFVCKLRRKLAEAGAGSLIATVWGRGYVLRDSVEAPSDDIKSPSTSFATTSIATRNAFALA
ncbi:MAG TPA: response regulator transcription factor [Roseomonas sp.]